MHRPIHRRDFVLGGIKVSLAFLAFDSFPFSALAKDFRGVACPPGLDDSLELLAAYLAAYTPPTGQFPATGAWTASYDLCEWAGTPSQRKPGQPKDVINRSIGRLAFTRHAPTAAGIAYDLDYSIDLYGWMSTLKSTMQCTADRIPALVSWHTDYENHPLKRVLPPVTLAEDGQVRDGTMQIASKAGTRQFKTGGRVSPQWAVIDAVRAAKADPADPLAGTEFDLLFDLTSYRPRQTIKPAGTCEVTLGGQTYQLHGFVQIGSGSEPTHYWADDSGRTLLITGGLLSSALTSIQPA